MTKTELIKQRALAGAAYAAAAASYVDAWVTLHALDTVATNGNVNAVDLSRAGVGGQPQLAGHPEFLRDTARALHDPSGRAASLAAAMLDSISA